MDLSSTRVITFFVITCIIMVGGNEKLNEFHKKNKEHGNLYTLSDVKRELANEDLEEGLRSLSSSELRTLSKFIDEESKSSESNAFQDVMKNYWNSRLGSDATKKRRTIDDLYDEMAHENAELDIRHEHPNVKEPVDDGRCHCVKQPQRDDAIRTKRDNLNANVEEKPSNDKYIRQLEQSFPQDQLSNLDNDEINFPKNEHKRIKRL